jgi:phage shock protein A
MTSEERFTKIENALSSLAEHQVQHEEKLARIEKSLDRHIDFVGTSLARLDTSLTRLEEQVAQTSQQVNRTSAAQEITERRMQELIGKVDSVDSRVDKLEKK